MTSSFRTVWISDLRLATSECRALEFMDFLRNVTSENFFLVGDIIDFQQFGPSSQLPEAHRRVLRAIMRIAARRRNVTFVPGDRDRDFRDLAGEELCGVRIALEARYRTGNGQRFLITHGDTVDRRIRQPGRLKRIGTRAARWLIEADSSTGRLWQPVKRLDPSMQNPYEQPSEQTAQHVRLFEAEAARYAANRGFDGIICGHTGCPGIRDIEGTCYANDGDWVNQQTALVETATGTLQLISWECGRYQVLSPAQPLTTAA